MNQAIKKSMGVNENTPCQIETTRAPLRVEGDDEFLSIQGLEFRV